MRKIEVIALAATLSPLSLFAHWANTTEGVGDKTDSAKYACALISNGSISTQIDNLGVQKPKKYVSFVPQVAWEGRRYGAPKDSLISHGSFDTVLSVGGKIQDKPVKWKQTLDNKSAFSENVVEYHDATVKTVAFVPAGRDMLVVRKTITPKKEGVVKFDFVYKFAPQTRFKERERVSTVNRIVEPNRATFEYIAIGMKAYKGMISLMSDFPSAPTFADGDMAVLSSESKVSPTTPLEISYFITFNDNFEKPDYKAADSAAKAFVQTNGFDKIFADHKAVWAKYWQGSHINIPNKEIENTYYTGLYHQRCNSTKWSLPVGVFVDSHWDGRFFGWDEAFNSMALATSGKFDDSRKVSDFRTKHLGKAIYWVNKLGKRRSSGARYVWESTELGDEAAPYGFWMEHIFHMSNMAMATWGHYLYSNDRDFLKKNYELMVESSLYYVKNRIYNMDGATKVGYCTDLERMGEAKFNAFMTSCGIIYTLEKTAAAADILGVDADLAKQFREIAAKLRKSLPNDGEKYVPYEGSKDYSIGSVGGFYPYPVLDPKDKLAEKAVYDFHKNIDKGGNMYDMGNGVNAWYAGWMSSALVNFNDKTNPAMLLAGAAKETGSFYDTYEINEPANKVQKCPWFSTGSGNYVYAVNQMLLRPSENGDIYLCSSVPDSWNDIDFCLPTYGGLWLNADIKDGKLVSASLEARGKGDKSAKRTLLVPARFVDTAKILTKWEKRGEFVAMQIEVGKKFYK